MFTPQFPYKGNQVIISTGRVTLHSKDDAIFLFGKQAVGISTPKTFNVDANEATKINSPIIELGLRASTEGEPTLKGDATIQQLDRALSAIGNLATALKGISFTELEISIPLIRSAAQILEDTAKSVSKQLNTPGVAKSITTYTK
jgi:hypothetical protein